MSDDLKQRLRNFNPKIIMNDAADRIGELEYRIIHLEEALTEAHQQIAALKQQIDDDTLPW